RERAEAGGAGAPDDAATTELRAVQDRGPTDPRTGPTDPRTGPTDPRTGLGNEATQELSLRGRGTGAADLTATAKLPVVPDAPAGPSADETAVLPRIPAEAADRTAVLPRIGSGAPADQAPPARRQGERAVAEERPVERTRELPVVDPRQDPPAEDTRPRPDWAEETPLDDLPSLTDTLLGSREEWARWGHDDRPRPDGAGGQGRQDGRSGQGAPEGRSDQGGQDGGKGKGRRWGRRG
ncbi:hypothetical protein ACFVFS_09955, partial [Kitasatospora sp. NPDC057692]